jgi:hypothetical protein
MRLKLQHFNVIATKRRKVSLCQGTNYKTVRVLMWRTLCAATTIRAPLMDSAAAPVKRHYIHALVNNAHLINSSIQAGRCLLSF